MIAVADIALELRRTAGLFATGVTVVTVHDPETGEPHGMTANGFMSVSLDPPLVVVSIGRRAKLHELLETSAHYGVTLLGSDLEGEARRFAGQAIRRGPAEFEVHEQTPVLAGGLAWLATRIVDRHPAGDHTLFVGEVVDMGTPRPDAPPLAFFRSQFSAVTPHRSGSIGLDAWSDTDLWG